jgi:DNA repair exonuclease SbcCD ATPase subunit
MNTEHVTKLLKAANNDLPGLENEYERLKEGVNSLYEQKRDLNRIIPDLSNQKTELANFVGHYRALCRQEEAKLKGLRQLLRQFENNNEEYIKIIKTAEERVNNTLSERKDLLKLAVLSLTESMKNDPEKYGRLIYGNMPSTIHYINPLYPPYGYGFDKYRQEHHQSREDYIAMLIEEADKLYNKMLKEYVYESIEDL